MRKSAKQFTASISVKYSFQLENCVWDALIQELKNCNPIVEETRIHWMILI